MHTCRHDPQLAWCLPENKTFESSISYIFARTYAHKHTQGYTGPVHTAAYFLRVSATSTMRVHYTGIGRHLGNVFRPATEQVDLDARSVWLLEGQIHDSALNNGDSRL